MPRKATRKPSRARDESVNLAALNRDLRLRGISQPISDGPLLPHDLPPEAQEPSPPAPLSNPVTATANAFRPAVVGVKRALASYGLILLAAALAILLDLGVIPSHGRVDLIYESLIFAAGAGVRHFGTRGTPS